MSAKLTVYLYSEDEASFDFSEAIGTSKLMAWKRDVSNSYYNESENTYYMIDSDTSSEISYAFAVDMSKVPIPEKLTGLLYMLPGGDQEGRTAWDFLLQLAERISPLTTVSISLTIPEGFTADTSALRLANEYFTLGAVKVEGNKLTIVCNFIAQSEPINPTTANPLCVLTGLKLVPTDDAAWSDDGKLNYELNGNLDYDIYAHFHVLKSLAQQEKYQKEYGLYPYDNSENIEGDYGAHFMDTADSFSDKFVLKKNSKDGWARENGLWSFYRDGKALIGIQKLPSHIDGEEGEFWYDLGTQGSCTDKLTGLFEYEGDLYYAINGETKDGWREIDKDGSRYHYYFDLKTHKAVDGVQKYVRLLLKTENSTARIWNILLKIIFLCVEIGLQSVPVVDITGLDSLLPENGGLWMASAIILGIKAMLLSDFAKYQEQTVVKELIFTYLMQKVH